MNKRFGKENEKRPLTDTNPTLHIETPHQQDTNGNKRKELNNNKNMILLALENLWHNKVHSNEKFEHTNNETPLPKERTRFEDSVWGQSLVDP